jgi:acyl-CoA reductase-like NAD-dependent aldehyde dehydrogenase
VPENQPSTLFHASDRALLTLAQHKDRWLQVALPDRITYLQRCMAGVNAVAANWAIAAAEAKGIDLTSPLVGEEWLVGPVATLANLRELIQTLSANGQPQPNSIYTRSDGQVVAQILPNNLYDRLLWQGFTGEVWMQPGTSARQGLVYRQPPAQGRVALVLGAGNIAAIAAMDTLYKLFAEDQVVLLKMNPVNEYVGKFLEQAFQPLIQAGFLQIVYGGADVGQYLCQQDGVDTIHITGSHHTHDAIVWGSDPPLQRKAETKPLMPKPITSELGCVTPILIVPGNWSMAEMQFQARHVASMVAHNASFNCVAGKVMVMAKDWPLRDRFLQLVQTELAQTPPRKAYYPGARQRYAAFLQQYPQAIPLHESGADAAETDVPWTLIPAVPPLPGEYALRTEAFCGILAEVGIPGSTVTQFLANAVPFVNETIWGNLSCVMLVDPKTQHRHVAVVEQAIGDLRYGAIGVNVWTGAIFLLAACPWGAFPGNDLVNIQSGRGIVHNTYLFEQPQKTVLRAPFQIFPTPLWFADHKNLLQVARCYASFLTDSNLPNLFQLLMAALKG